MEQIELSHLVTITTEITPETVPFEVLRWQVIQKQILGTRERMLMVIKNTQRYGENFILGRILLPLVRQDGMFQQMHSGKY